MVIEGVGKCYCCAGYHKHGGLVAFWKSRCLGTLAWCAHIWEGKLALELGGSIEKRDDLQIPLNLGGKGRINAGSALSHYILLFVVVQDLGRGHLALCTLI